MSQRTIGPYLEQQILGASPLQLIHLSYQTAIQAVRDARRFLQEKKIGDRCRSISLAHGVLAQLYSSLDFHAGDGAISVELGRLYDYMMRRLLEANARQTDEPLAETLDLLCSLSSAWEQISATADQSAPKRPVREAAPWELLMDAPQSSYSLSFCG